MLEVRSYIDSSKFNMAKRPSTLDCTAFLVPVDDSVGDQGADSRPIARTSSLPAVPCRRRVRRSYRRPRAVRAGSFYTGIHDRERTTGDNKPEVEYSPEVSRSWSMTALSSSYRSVFRAGNVTAATSFQTCVDGDEEDLALTTSTSDSGPPDTVLQELSPRRRRVAAITSVVNPVVRPPRHDGRRLCPPETGSRGRRSASMGAVRPSTTFRSRLNNCNADFGEKVDDFTYVYN